MCDSTWKVAFVAMILLAGCSTPVDPTRPVAPDEIRGRVLDEQGKPFGGAWVQLSGNQISERTESDLDGWFHFTGLKPGGTYHRLWVSADTGFYRKKGAHNQRSNVPAGSDLVIRLLRSGRLKFRVFEEGTERPVLGAPCRLEPTPWGSSTGFVSTTKEKGFTTFHGRGGDWKGHLKVADYLLLPVSFSIPPAGEIEKTFFVRRGQTVTGRVLWDDGTPLAGTSIRLKHPWENYDEGQTHTCPDGTFALSGFRANVRYTLWVEPKGYNTVRRSKVVLPRAHPLRIILPRKPWVNWDVRAMAQDDEINGWILDENGTPDAQAEVVAIGNGQRVKGRVWSNGWFDLHGLAADVPYKVVVTTNKGVYDRIQGVWEGRDIRVGASLVVHVRRVGRVQLRVLNVMNHKPVANAECSLVLFGQVRGSQKTDARGELTFPLPAQEFRGELRVPGHGVALVGFTIPPAGIAYQTILVQRDED